MSYASRDHPCIFGTMETLKLIGAMLGSGTITALIQGWLHRRKVSAEVSQTKAAVSVTQYASWKQAFLDLDDHYRKLHNEVILLREEQVKMRAELTALKVENQALRLENERLINQQT